MTQKQSIIQAILDYYRTNLHITSAIPIEKILVYVNKTSHLFDNYHQLKTLSLDELPGYIDNYASCANFSLAQIQQIKDVIENTCTKQQIMGTIDSKLITKYFLSIIDTLKKKALTKEQLFVQEFMLEYSNLMTEELKTKGLLDELVDSDKSIKKRKLHSELHRERSRELIAHIREITDHMKQNPRYSINHSSETTCVNNTTQDATNHTSRIYKNISKFGSEIFLKLLLSSPSNLLMIACSFLLTSRMSALNTQKFSL